jgi:hypothetical protein
MTKVLGSFPKMNRSKRITWQKYLDIFLKLMRPKRAHGSNGSFLWTIVNVPRSSPNSRSPYLVHMAIDAYEHQNESWNNFLKEKCKFFFSYQ